LPQRSRRAAKVLFAFDHNNGKTAMFGRRRSVQTEKNLHSFYTGKKWGIFASKINSLRETYILVGTTGFEPATPTPPAAYLVSCGAT
jgi:hypothetical protein